MLGRRNSLKYNKNQLQYAYHLASNFNIWNFNGYSDLAEMNRQQRRRLWLLKMDGDD